MKIDFSKEILDLENNAVKSEAGEVVTLKSVSTTALLNPRAGVEPNADAAVKKFSLAMTIHGAKGPVDLKAEEVVLLKASIGAIYAPLVVGRAFELLDK